MLYTKFLKVIGLLVLKKVIFEGFYHIWAWTPSRSCDPEHLNFLSPAFSKKSGGTLFSAFRSA